MITINNHDLDTYFRDLLHTEAFSDYCPNGMQVEGNPNINKLVFGVTACQALIDQAIEVGAQGIVVHHGYFWKGEPSPIMGMKRTRLKSLLSYDINMWGFHLPLDCHQELGNNAQLGRMLALEPQGWLEGEGVTGLGLWGQFTMPTNAQQIETMLREKLGRSVLHVAPDDRPIRKIGWCTGGAQGYITKAIDLGLDAYISGEISESTVHTARENGIHYFCAGHHATERGGPQALSAHIGKTFDIECEFIDIDSPA